MRFADKHPTVTPETKAGRVKLVLTERFLLHAEASTRQRGLLGGPKQESPPSLPTLIPGNFCSHSPSGEWLK